MLAQVLRALPSTTNADHTNVARWCDKGRTLADKAGNSLSEIVSMSGRVMDMIQQIATSSGEQSIAAEQISKNIEYISSVTKETAAGAEQSAAAAEEPHRTAESRQKIVSQFKVS